MYNFLEIVTILWEGFNIFWLVGIIKELLLATEIIDNLFLLSDDSAILFGKLVMDRVRLMLVLVQESCCQITWSSFYEVALSLALHNLQDL